MRSVIAISVEGLGTSLIGGYGSNTAVTPAIDTLAAEGIVFDQCFLDSQDLTQQLGSLASAKHALQPQEPCLTIWDQLSASGTQATFLTDSAEAATWAESAGCKRVLLIDPPQNNEPEEDPAECAIIALLLEAGQEMAEHPEGLLWIHSSGLRLPWDAPLELRRQFIDPDDPQPPSEVQPPAFEVTDSTDPDLVVGWTQVAAAQVAMLDDGIASLRSILESRADADSWSWIVLGTGGFPLGEHGRVGWGRSQLHAEELQCVAVVKPSPAPEVGWRRAELIQLPDIGAILFQCCGLEIATKGESRWGQCLLEVGYSDTPHRWKPAHALAVVCSETEVWIRCPAWSAVLPDILIPTESDVGLNHRSRVGQPRLYVKPDDRWEVSEIADRCPDIVEQLCQHASAFKQAAAMNDRNQLPALAPQLCNLMR